MVDIGLLGCALAVLVDVPPSSRIGSLEYRDPVLLAALNEAIRGLLVDLNDRTAGLGTEPAVTLR
jgi:hypothetical protein